MPRRSSPPDRDREALERAILAEPHDVGPWLAYARWLHGRGDPRGEYMQLQLALEDVDLSDAEERGLRARVRELLRAHRDEWLGPLARLRGGWAGFRRGWVQRAEAFLTPADARALAGAPEVTFLNGLGVVDVLVGEEPGEVVAPAPGERADALRALADWPGLVRLRSLDYGRPGLAAHHRAGRAVPALVARTPALRHLALHCRDLDPGVLALPLPELRGLTLGPADPFDASALGTNPTLGKVETVAFAAGHPAGRETGRGLLRAVARSPHLAGLRCLLVEGADLGAGAVAGLVASGLLGRLTDLALVGCGLRDADVEPVLACPDFGPLENLDVSGNRLTASAVRRLQALPLEVETGW